MAPNHENNCPLRVVEAEARTLAHRFGDILRCTCDHIKRERERERERLELDAQIADLKHQVADLTLKLNGAESTITSLTTAQSTLTRIIDQRNALSIQVNTLQSEP
ncbi:hypothetical protein MPER_02909 [Moniliophthora perniciosa FA553]|nr:hypothetical protein MPER_02909 [Moniliophthora perniciosa FA553]